MQAVWLLLVLTWLGESPEIPANRPYVLILGTAQDGGFPQIGCRQTLCERARKQPEFQRRVSSLLLVNPASASRWLFDASPDISLQVSAMQGHPASRKPPGARPPLFEGIFLTHAHMGHYGGLLHLGREAYDHQSIPLYCSAKMGAYLTKNGPWSLMVRRKNLSLRIIKSKETVRLDKQLKVRALEVPHRGEYTDTFGFVIEGPNRKLLFVPDIDKWQRWELRLADVLATVDVALLDGTFYADGEIPGRSMADIPHPFMVETMTLLAKLPIEARKKVVFTHLNHTNPACDPHSDAAAKVREAGMSIAQDGQVIGL